VRRFEVDPAAAPVVKRIFAEYIAGRGYFAIAAGLTRDGFPSPSAHDPARNRHRDTRSWSKIAVRSILQNPKYTGRQVWNRQRRDEILVDVEDVAQGHLSRMRWNDSSDWVWSTDATHEAIIDSETFAKAQAQMAAGAYRPTTAPTTRRRTYVLSGRVQCGICGHRMAGHANHGVHHYRCRFPRDWAPVEGMDHPPTVYVREDAIVPRLDEWIAGLFAPENLDETCRALVVAGGTCEVDHARLEAAQRKLADCDKRLVGYRKALDDGADPVIVSGWINETQGERLRAENELAAAQPAGAVSEREIRTLVDSLGDVAAVLADADPKLKAQLYEDLGIDVRYDPAERTATACATVRVGGGT
jgi:site-specific DNA recombinase